MSYEYICHKTINNILYESCESGNIDELIYIFENHYKNIYVKKEYIFYLVCCHNGSYKALKYITRFYWKINKKINIHKYTDVIIRAAENYDTPVVCYLIYLSKHGYGPFIFDINTQYNYRTLEVLLQYKKTKTKHIYTKLLYNNNLLNFDVPTINKLIILDINYIFISRR